MNDAAYRRIVESVQNGGDRDDRDPDSQSLIDTHIRTIACLRSTIDAHKRTIDVQEKTIANQSASISTLERTVAVYKEIVDRRKEA